MGIGLIRFLHALNALVEGVRVQRSRATARPAPQESITKGRCLPVMYVSKSMKMLVDAGSCVHASASIGETRASSLILQLKIVRMSILDAHALAE